MATLQASASANDPLSMSEVVSHFGQSGTQSLRSYLRDGGIVTSSKSTNTNQSAPNSNGTYNDFGGVSSLVLVKSEVLASNFTYSFGSNFNIPVQYTTNANDVGDIIGFQHASSNDASWQVRRNGTIIKSGNLSGGTYGPSNYLSDTMNASGQVYQLYTSGGENYNGASVWFKRYSDSYTFTNNTGGSITVNSTTWSSGSQTISPSGGSYTISFTTSINSSVPTSGTLSLLDFLSADNGA